MRPTRCSWAKTWFIVFVSPILGQRVHRLTLVDTLPAEVTFLSASPGCANLSGVVTCSLPDLITSNGVTVTITVIPYHSRIRTNTATVTCTENDPVSGNNTSTVQTTVIYHKVYLPLVKK